MRRLAALSTVLLLACSANVVDGDEGATTGSSTGHTSSETSTGPEPAMTTSDASAAGSEDSTTSSIAWETEGADEGYATTGGCGFTCPQPGGGGAPGGGALECSIAAQDCPDGEKCAPWANDGSNVWNATRCVPLASTPDTIGAPCTFEGTFAFGVDTCDVGLWCGPESGPESGEDPKDTTGTCHQLCGADPCPLGTQCVAPGFAEIGVCQDTCDPLGDPCPGSQACMPAGFGFVCHLVGREGAAGEPCRVTSACAAGLACVEAPQCDDEVTERCCVPYCDQGAPGCPDGQRCVDYGSPLPEFDNVGYCAG